MNINAESTQGVRTLIVGLGLIIVMTMATFAPSPAVAAPIYSVYAEDIVSFQPGSGVKSTAPIENILGVPDTATEPWENTGSFGNYGWVVVDMGPEGINDMPGDDIFVWFGGWSNSYWTEAQEGFTLEASVNGTDFVLVGDMPLGPDVSNPVVPFSRNMDLGDSGLTNARYLRITDTGTDLSAGGLEVNAIQGLVPEPASLSLIGLISGGIYFTRRFFIT